MTVFFVCAGILGLLAVVLGLNVGRMRGRKRVSLGDGGDKELAAAIRAHGNLIEWVPLGLLLIWLTHGPYGDRSVAVLAVVLTVGRLFHAGGMLGLVPSGRTIGAIATVFVLAYASIELILAGLGIRLF
jgi:uncharacterized membrane protein YecN with MAPEG domain